MAEQLFLAHLLRRRDEAAFHRLAELLLDGFDFMFLLLMHEADADAGLVGAACSSAAVHVSVDVVREVIINNMCQVVDVEAASRHVGSHQNLREALAEMVHHEVALCLREVAMQRSSVVAVVDKVVGHILSLEFGAAEHYAVNRRVIVD